MQTIHFSDNRSILSVIEIDGDNHAERAGMFRAYWVAALPDGRPDPDACSHVTVIGYCSPGGSHRTITAAVREVRGLYPHEPVYRAVTGRRLGKVGAL